MWGCQSYTVTNKNEIKIMLSYWLIFNDLFNDTSGVFNDSSSACMTRICTQCCWLEISILLQCHKYVEQHSTNTIYSYYPSPSTTSSR